jgi:hypothetical protein
MAEAAVVKIIQNYIFIGGNAQQQQWDSPEYLTQLVWQWTKQSGATAVKLQPNSVPKTYARGLLTVMINDRRALIDEAERVTGITRGEILRQIRDEQRRAEEAVSQIP